MKKDKVFESACYDVYDTHPSQDMTNRFAVDRLIRDCGFTIYQRKNGKEAVWQKDNILFNYSEVLLRIDPEKIMQAKELEVSYFS